MATDVWALSAIASPATTDRVPIATGSNTGGYSLRAEFVWKGGGVFKADAPVQITAASGNAVLNLIETGVRNWAVRSGALATNIFDIADLTAGSSRFSINQSGNVGIGIATPGVRLHVKSSGQIAAIETATVRGSGDGYLSFRDPTGMKAYVGYGGATDKFYLINAMNAPMSFGTNDFERMTIDAAGKVGIGTTGPSSQLHVRASGEIGIFETVAARGSGNGYISIYDPTGRKCYMGYGTSSDTLTIVNELNGPVTFGTNGNYRWSVGAAGAFEPFADNTYNIGHSSFRVAVVYAATGTINTSDANDKDWLATGFSPELLSAAKRISVEIGSYKWLDAIQRETEGGPAARIHFGVRAQAVWEIMADEGLIDPLQEGVTPSSPYAFLCWNEVEDRPEGRFGIRPDQLALFLIAAQEARIAALEDLLP